MRTNAEWDILIARQRKEVERINNGLRELNIMPPLDSFTVHKIETDPLIIHELMSEERNTILPHADTLGV